MRHRFGPRPTTCYPASLQGVQSRDLQAIASHPRPSEHAGVERGASATNGRAARPRRNSRRTTPFGSAVLHSPGGWCRTTCAMILHSSKYAILMPWRIVERMIPRQLTKLMRSPIEGRAQCGRRRGAAPDIKHNNNEYQANKGNWYCENANVQYTGTCSSANPPRTCGGGVPNGTPN